MRVADVVREVLNLAALKQGEFAKEVGVSQGTVSKWLSDKQGPNKRQWDAVLALISHHPRLGHLLPAAGGPTVARVPLLDAVSAGRLADPATQIPVEDVHPLIFADLGRGDFFALKVEGDSMDRISPEGSVIVVNRQERELVAGKPYIFSVKGATTFKVWRADPARLEPSSTNPANQTIYIRRIRDFEVVGRVRRTVLDL